MEKLLSIAIPTYNRAECLQDTLKNFIAQIEYYNLNSDIELVISDNASTDNTKEIISKIIEEHGNVLIRYSSNEKNLIWENLKIAAELSQGKYVWIFGDDDYCLWGGVNYIVSILKSGQDFTNIITNFITDSGLYLKNGEDKIVSLDEALILTKLQATSLNCNIFKREVLSSSKYRHYTFYHYDSLLNFPSESKTYLASKPCYFVQTLNVLDKENSWKNNRNFIIYGIEMFDTINNSQANARVKKVLLDEMRKELFRLLKQKRSRNFFMTDKEMKELAEAFKESFNGTWELKDKLLYYMMIKNRYITKLLCKLYKFVNKFKK